MQRTKQEFIMMKTFIGDFKDQPNRKSSQSKEKQKTATKFASDQIQYQQFDSIDD